MSLPETELQSAIDELKAIFGERLSTSTGVRDHHSKDESWHHPHRQSEFLVSVECKLLSLSATSIP